MDSIGTEVGQKMRSAIKAKLMELGCYVDDELPDYVMVMVANKRTRIQMEEDLQLFLRTNTKLFVDWLQQVLNKLKEVTITNPGVYACSSFKELKRKASLEIAECLIKKEKKDKKHKPDKKPKAAETVSKVKSLTDEIPVNANNLVEKRNQNNRILLNLENIAETSTETKNTNNDLVNRNDFDIPSLADVSELQDCELDVIEDKIKEARDRIVLMKSDSEDEDFINIQADAEELLSNELNDASNPSNLEEQPNKTNQKIIKLKRNVHEYSNNNAKETTTTVPIKTNAAPTLKLSLSERLGNPPKDTTESLTAVKKASQDEAKKLKLNLSETLREEKEFSGKFRGNSYGSIIKQTPNIIAKRESVHKRLGIPSSVISLARKSDTSHVPEQQTKSVPSMVQVKPRRINSGPCQPNKNLLLKAVAEAQKSVTQATTRTNMNKEALYTKKYREKHNLVKEKKPLPTKSKAESESVSKVQNIIIEIKSKNPKSNATILDEGSSDYISTEVTKDTESNVDDTDYVPSTIDLNYDDLDKYMEDIDEQSKPANENAIETEVESTNHQFIVTLDGLKNEIKEEKEDNSNSSTEEIQKVTKKCPSPIIFDKGDEIKKPKSICKIPEKLPKVHLPVPVKTKERCKYWPTCWLGDSCEYIHPKTTCKAFPLCKFGDHCLYIHPKCKFDSSCTRKDCPYSHKNTKVPPKIVSRSTSYHSSTPLDICKYYPNCSNPHCQYYHPKICRFGKYCMNKAECNFSHGKIPTKEKLKWHSGIR